MELRAGIGSQSGETIAPTTSNRLGAVVDRSSKADRRHRTKLKPTKLFNKTKLKIQDAQDDDDDYQQATTDCVCQTHPEVKPPPPSRPQQPNLTRLGLRESSPSTSTLSPPPPTARRASSNDEHDKPAGLCRIYFKRINDRKHQEETSKSLELIMKQTRRRRRGRRRSNDDELSTPQVTRQRRDAPVQLRQSSSPAKAMPLRKFGSVLAPIIIMSMLAASIMLISTQANSQVIELGEGLTLNQNNGRQSSLPTGDYDRQQQHEWPLQNLDRIKAESKVSAVLGQNVILNCAVQFKDGQEKPFVVNWLKFPHKMPIYIYYAGYPPHVAHGYENRVTRIGQASLNLSSIRESDQGLYECKIYYLDRRPEDKTNGTYVYLDVQAPPHFTQTPPPISYVQAGDSLHLTCQAQSTPAPYLRWYKNKVPIDSDAGPYRLSSSTGQPFLGYNHHHHQQQQQQQQPSATAAAAANSQTIDKQAKQLEAQNTAQLDLFIDNVQAGQTTGDYFCLASNSEGSIEARSQIVLAVPAVITTWPRNQTRLEGERVELLCQAKALPANITYKWLFNNKPLQQLKWFDSRYTIKRDGTLVIHSLHRDDQGEYKCQATNGLSHRTRTLPDNTNNSEYGGIGNNDSDQSTKQSATGIRRNQQTLASAAATTTTTTTTKTNMPPTTPAPIYAEAAAYLNVEFPARVTYSPPVQFLPLGLAGLIRCHVQSVPPVEFFTWTLNNQQFDPNSDPNIERLQNGSLVIKQVSESYAGQYRCTPFNKHGSAGSSAAMEVRVQEPPHFLMRPDDFYKANLNGQIKMPCDGRGSPKPNVSWRRVMQVPRKAHLSRNETGGNGESTTGAADQQRPKREPRRTGGATTITRHFNNNNNHQAHLAYDEAADEPDETHHFYATTSATVHQDHAMGDASPTSMLLDGQTTDNNNNNNNHNNLVGGDETTNQQQLEQEQQTVIVYAKLPSDRSEYKNSYLYLHNLRKEDHGRYECVIENEVATLVASTMLYIEETTPHAPTDVRVDTKVWSAHVSWTPGYDGGFEQSFVVWYRQVDRPKQSHQSSGEMSVTAQTTGSEFMTNSQQLNDVIDINWHSQSVQSSDATNLVVQNLSQDTTYEFYVRAKNIIGEGPRSQVVQATTKRAILGSVTPINAISGAELIAASTVAGISDELNNVGQTQRTTNYEPNEEDVEPAAVTPLTSSIRPYLIIHPEYVSPANSNNLATSNNNASNILQTKSSKTNDNNNNNNNNNDQFSTSQPVNFETSDSSSTTMSSNKVIKIYFPNSNKQHQQSNGNDSSSSPTIVGKRTSIDQSEHQSSNSNSNPSPQVPADQSTAPQNVSMMKVAQGWVLSWAPPLRLPNQISSFGGEHAEAIHQTNSNQAASSVPQQQQQADEQVSGETSLLSSQLLLESKASKDQRRSQMDDQQPFVYSIELKEKNSSAWQTLATSREQSLLLKDLKIGGDYQFRVIAHTASGLKGSPSAEFRYAIPDNKRKPGLTQAFSATVTSGLLFFIACIVIAVCGVNMCNKRRKKRAEKAAYVMMACPVLESHHDIAALNSNSLLKNSTTNATQNRVSSLTGQQWFSAQQQPPNDRYHLERNLRLSSSSSSSPPTRVRQSERLRVKLFRSRLQHYGRIARNRLASIVPFLSASPESSPEARNNLAGQTGEPSSNRRSAEQPISNIEREINFSSNEPFPVDVDPEEETYEQPNDVVETHQASSSDLSPPANQQPNDDYWVRQPSDRKWGTLTLAASKLAERRAAANLTRVEQASQNDACESTNNTGEAYKQNLLYHHRSSQTGANRTLPRSFKANPQDNRNQLEIGQQDLSQIPPRVPPRPALVQVSTPPLLPPKNSTQLQNQDQQQPLNKRQTCDRLAPDQMHRRSISQIEAKSLALANQRQSSLVSGQQLRSLTHNWPVTAWTQQDLHDWASMSFGPPATSFQSANDCAGSWAQQLPPEAPSIGAQDYNQSATINTPLCAWAQEQQDQLLSYTASMDIHNYHQQQQQLEKNTEVTNGVNQPISTIKRNSLARSTLPMTSGVSSNLLGQSVLAPPYNLAHDQHALFMQHRQQQQQSIVVCPFYPPPMATILPTFAYDPAHQPRPEQPPPPPPLPPPPSTPSSGVQLNGLVQSHTHQHTNNIFNDNDDPLTENACLGSYKRKRRLPHIEAQFTMTKLAPELPPKDDTDAGAPPSQRPGFQCHGRTNSAFVLQPETLDQSRVRIRSSSQSEAQSYQPSGGLFVRDDIETTTPVGSGGLDNGQLVVVPSLPEPRGMPQSGQRTEQRLLKESTNEMASLHQVDTMDASEKIETYLRSHHHHHSDRQKQPASVVGRETSKLQSRTPNSLSSSSSLSNISPVELDQVDELTFQPYYNLPSLKYTIALPVRQTQNGQLVIEDSSQLKARRRGSKRRGVRPARTSGNSLTGCEPRPNSGDSRLRHGSCSSCPTGDSATIQEFSSSSQADSYQSSNGRPPMDGRTTIQADSLEVLQIRSHETDGCQPVSSSSNNNNRPGGIRISSNSNSNGSRSIVYTEICLSDREAGARWKEPAPPPVPPHRNLPIELNELSSGTDEPLESVDRRSQTNGTSKAHRTSQAAAKSNKPNDLLKSQDRYQVTTPSQMCPC